MKAAIFVPSDRQILLILRIDAISHEGPAHHHDILAFVILVYLYLPVILVLQVLDKFDILVC